MGEEGGGGGGRREEWTGIGNGVWKCKRNAVKIRFGRVYYISHAYADVLTLKRRARTREISALARSLALIDTPSTRVCATETRGENSCDVPARSRRGAGRRREREREKSVFSTISILIPISDILTSLPVRPSSNERSSVSDTCVCTCVTYADARAHAHTYVKSCRSSDGLQV